MLRGSRNAVALTFLVLTFGVVVLAFALDADPRAAVPVIFIGLLSSAVPRQVAEWERGVLLRFGTFERVLEPGVVWLVPGLDTIAKLVDMRIRTTPISADKAFTKDTVPVHVDAVLIWVVTDAKHAVLEVQDYEEAIQRAAQTTLRDIVGRAELVRLLSDRATIDAELQTLIDAKTSEWGITVQSIEICSVRIPAALEEAMSRKAQAIHE